ncbi:hypothetical protein QQS21_005085 [Conoideocrella luteorostrata]|uniref:Uncharacterized protein n=1 Tax=Conoideocrella luteorostrata TaxID=1105319 RepID=A0AAJ0FZC9_9HYPO|nr:hypothetical protein QQS21_005085 [Conoideocrella luteorostrata]
MVKDASIWTMVHAAATGFMMVPILITGLLTLVLARRRQDPARVAFIWLKGCHPLLLLSLTCIISADILNVILFSWQNDGGYYDTANHTHDEISSLIRSERYLSFCGNLFEHLVDLIFVLVLVELGNGLMYSLDRQSSGYQIKLRYTAYVTILFLFSMAMSYFGQPTSAWVAYWNGSESNSSYAQLTQSLKIVGKLGASFYIPSWIVSIAQVAYASFVMRKHKAGVLTRHVAILYLTITVLDFVRWTFFLVLYAQWILPAQENPSWWNLIDALGNTWIRFSQLVMLLIIGMRRKKGIWTTHQSWMKSSVSTMASEMASTTTTGPSPIMAPGTVYHHALYPHKEYAAHSPMQNAWYMSQQVPSWQHHELAAPAPQPMIMMPRDFDSMQYQYAPHPMLGPGYLVLQSQPHIQHYQQLQQQHQPQQQTLDQTLQSHQQHRLQHQQSFHSQQHQLQHQQSFQFQQHHTQ